MTTLTQQAKRPIRSIREGYRQMLEKNELVNAYIVVFLGNFLGWFARLFYTYKITGDWGFGPLGGWELVLQFIFSAIISVVITTGVWPKLKDLEPTYRFFWAFTAGATTNLGIDFLVSAGYLAQSVM